MKVKILNCNTYITPEGKVIETYSRPNKPAPDGRYDSPTYAWHDVLGKWVLLSDVGKLMEADI